MCYTIYILTDLTFSFYHYTDIQTGMFKQEKQINSVTLLLIRKSAMKTNVINIVVIMILNNKKKMFML